MKRLITFCFLCLTYLGFAQVTPVERAALQAFYTAAGGPTWNSETDADPTNDWDFGGPVTSNWFGVTVVAGNVVELNFNIGTGFTANNMNGFMPPEIGDLVNLRVLDLIRGTSPGLSGPLPPEIWALTNLENLNLTGNQLTGIIPPEVTNLVNLQQLYLGGCSFSGPLPLQVTTMNTLERLQLGFNSFTGIISPDFANLTNLIELSVSGNQLTGTIPSEIGTMINLQFLSLGNQSISGTIPVEIGNLTNLLEFNLRSTDVGGPLPNTFANLINIEEFFIDGNQLEGTIPDFTALPNLDRFFLMSNLFQFGDFEDQFVFYSTNLTVFQDNPQANVDLEETRNLDTGQNTTMTVNCSGTQNTYQWFKDGVAVVDDARISGAQTETLTINGLLPIDSGEYYAEVNSNIVTDLTILRNDITLNVAPPCDLVVERAALLALYNAADGVNWTDNTNWGSAQPVGTWFGVTTNVTGCVTEVSLDNNNLVGTLPDEIGDLAEVQIFDLGRNQLSGTLPLTLTNMVSLEILSLEQNQFTGTIPASLGNVTSLVKLFLFDNQFNGTIPATLGNLVNLDALWLTRNDLTGSIPVELGNLILVQSLLLGGNQLTGSIPPELGNIDALRILSLENNQLSGNLPASLGDLVLLTSFDISNNQIEGQVPQEYVQWTDIGAVDLDNNQLEGDLPNFIFTNSTGNPVFTFENNRFQFGDFEDRFTYYTTNLSDFDDNPQALVNTVENIELCIGSTATLTTTVSGTANIYEWFKDGVAIPTSNTPTLTLNGFQAVDAGVYTCEIRSAIVTDLILERNPITLTVSNNGPMANTVNDIYACDVNDDGIENFTIDLAAIESQVLGSQTGLTVSYFDTMGNPLTLTASYTNTTANQQDITVRVEASPDCFDETTFSLIVNPRAVADVFSDVEECGSTGFDLAPLSPNNSYWTEPNQTGTQLNPGDIINQNTTIYIFAETGIAPNTCADESSFEIVINNISADVLDDVIRCNSYTLPDISVNNAYFTQGDGSGEQLSPGDELTETQTVYIFAQSGDCTDESSFQVTIDLVACRDAESLGLPKFFTPNGDGFNDIWDTSSLASQNGIRLTIYDRFGKLLKQFSPQGLAGWDGNFNGLPLPSADYWYVYEDTINNIILKGHFALKR